VNEQIFEQRNEKLPNGIFEIVIGGYQPEEQRNSSELRLNALSLKIMEDFFDGFLRRTVYSVTILIDSSRSLLLAPPDKLRA